MEEKWQEILPLQSLMATSTRDGVIETKLLHCSYFTLHFLCGVGRLSFPFCAKCSGAVEAFYHMVLDCQPMQTFWYEVTNFNSTILQLPIICNNLCCLLGYVENDTLCNGMKRFLCLLFFYAMEIIILHWESTALPSISLWLALVNNAIPMYKFTFEVRGCPKKWDKVWTNWLDSQGTPE